MKQVVWWWVAALYIETPAELRVRQFWESKPFDGARRLVARGLQNETCDSIPSVDEWPGVHAGTSGRKKQSYVMELAYVGAAFSGWQRQPDRRTVQEVVEDALEAVMGESPNVRVAGRTDAGVHALHQIARVRAAQPAEVLLQALEAASDDTWTCRSVRPVDDKFHPTFDAQSRSYLYLIDRKPLLGLVDDPLARFNAALRPLEGQTLDFLALSAGAVKTETTLCTLQEARAFVLDDSMAIALRGDRFLRRMVRILVATLVLGLLDDSVDLQRILESRDRRLSPKAAPPDGLIFCGASY